MRIRRVCRGRVFGKRFCCCIASAIALCVSGLALQAAERAVQPGNRAESKPGRRGKDLVKQSNGTNTLASTNQVAQSSTNGIPAPIPSGAGNKAKGRDTDEDGLSDAEELMLGTDPASRDTDGDGLADGEELKLGTDPRRVDTDGDGMPDGWELKNGLNPLAQDGSGDSDGDGVLNIIESIAATHPLAP